jgi:hypothetical protein
MPDRRALLIVLLLVSHAATCLARELPRAQVPAPLAPWVDWVLFEHPERACPLVEGQARCRWPGRLALDVSARGGAFTLIVRLDAEAEVGLPGSVEVWPQDVTASATAAVPGGVSSPGTPAVILASGERPVTRLLAGTWRIEGRLVWPRVPETLRVPDDVALVSLARDGVPVPHPRRDASGLLWLEPQRVEVAEGERDRLSIEVYRRVSDGMPVFVTTRMVLRVSGRSREVRLGRVVLDGATPVALRSDLPARLDETGELRVQVRAGTYRLEIDAHTEGVPERLVAPRHPSPWPEHEVWVWRADDDLRQVRLGGAAGVDPDRTSLDQDWRGMPAFLMKAGDALTLTTERRGQPSPPPDDLRLQREAWLDLDGRGYTLRDRIQGRLSRTWRLDMRLPAQLGRARIGAEPQLVTANPEGGLAGVELRSGDLSLVAESRLEDAHGRLPAVGWGEDVQSLSLQLHLPPGHDLWAVSGADQVSGTWVDDWTLLGFFLVLLVSLAIGKLAGMAWGGLALVMLVLAYHEPDAPTSVWVWLLAAIGLLRVLPAGRFRVAVRAAWAASLITLLSIGVPYVVQQVRGGLYPQIEQYDGGYGWGDFTLGGAAMAPQDAPGFAEMERGLDEDEMRFETAGKGASGKRKKMVQRQAVLQSIQMQDLSGYNGLNKQARQSLQQDPNAVVQTGPGIPNWRWRSWHLGWSGPVSADHELRLWITPPWVGLVLALARVLLLLAVAGRLVRVSWPGPGEVGSGSAGVSPGARSAVAAAALAVLLLAPTMARAGAGQSVAPPPPGDLLEALERRLLARDDCHPACVDTSLLSLSVKDGVLEVRAEVHAGDEGAWPIPGPIANWRPARAWLDGAASDALALGAQGFLLLRVPAGRHEVRLSGPVPPAQVVTVQFARSPRRVRVDAPGWSVEGLREDGRAEASIRLLRALPRAAGERAAGDGEPYDPAQLPPWLQVTRTLEIGVPWLVHTEVTRVSPLGSPVMVRVPLLDGESVVDSELRVEEGQVVLSLGRDDAVVRWTSSLDVREALTLRAAAGRPWSEVWWLRCSPIWQCAAEGIAPTRHMDGAAWAPVFHPWPGETVRVSFVRPVGVEGETLTVDDVKLVIEPGVRLSKGSLDLTLRSSQGGSHVIGLPKGAQTQTVTVDGLEEPFRSDEGSVNLSLKPGAHQVAIAWQLHQGMALMQRVPAVNVGAVPANARLSIHMPDDRWLLLAGGLPWGPAVLFWGVLLAALVGSLLLGRLRFSPLKGWQWALLSFGLMQLEVGLAIAVGGWFMAFHLRTSRPFTRPWRFDLFQIALAAWTVVALVGLYGAVHQGLLMDPDMQVAGLGSNERVLNWYAQRADPALPQPWVLSVPLWAWKVLMLLWSMWLAASLVRWAPWAWRAFSAGQLWMRLRKVTPPPRGRLVSPGGGPLDEAVKGESDQGGPDA